MEYYLLATKRLAGAVFAFSLCWVSSFAHASDAHFMPCFKEAAQRYHLNEYLLKAIALQESGMNPRANNTENFDDSEDIGIMQVNSWWLKNVLKDYGITRTRLWDPCLNIHTGAWILAQEVQKHGRGWEAIGYYNARTDWKRARYVRLIKAALNRVYSAYGISPSNVLDPTSPITAMPTKIASLAPTTKWGAAKPRRMQRQEQHLPNRSRRIIVVSAAGRDDEDS